MADGFRHTDAFRALGGRPSEIPGMSAHFRKCLQIAFDVFPQSGKCLQTAFDVFPLSGKVLQNEKAVMRLSGQGLETE
ncbi:MAG: hypothetical protein K2I74_00465, partial [Treponemataceae bacterium]|nr:hypothetical protein [Treponemataceae bacterium]